ncbi:ATP-NAD kinase-like domain-containing protein [Hypoxylon sp. FL1284]|nr:ATP-NAD kinase-like domain-containing protein [Hypoxylon sp. FL1284]
MSTSNSSMGPVKPEDIVLISSSQSQAPSKPDAHDVFSLTEETGEQGPIFKLSQTQATDVPQHLLDQFSVRELPQHLQSGPSRHVHVVVSTGSGTGLSLKFYGSVLRPLLESWGVRPLAQSADPAERSKPNRYNLVVTQDADSVRNLAQHLGQATSDAVQHTVVLLSGDGGVIEMLNGKAPGDTSGASTSLPLVAILPLGTGNALFYSLHKLVMASAGTPEPSGLVQSLRTFFTGRAAPLPSFKAEFSPGSRIISYALPGGQDAEVESRAGQVAQLHGAIVASYGLHSQLVWESDTPEYRRHGDKRFVMVAQELLKESHAYEADVEIASPAPGAPREKIARGRHAYVLAALVSNLERSFTISPASRPLDGRLRLVHFGPVAGDHAMEIMMQARDEGKHVGMTWDDGGEEGEQRVGYDEAAAVKITTREEDARWRKVCIDGTIVELPRGGSMTVTMEDRPHLQVLVDKSVVG